MDITKECIERARMTGDTVPAANLIADVLHMAATEATRWSNRCDDAMRIQDWLYDASVALREYARECIQEKINFYEQEEPAGSQRPGTSAGEG